LIEPDLALAEGLFDELERGTRDADGAGVSRESYGAGEALAHGLVAAAGAKLGLTLERDAALNLYMTMAGRDEAAPRIIVGSHLDSVMRGGNYDGAAGVVAGLAALAGFRLAGKQPARTTTVMAIRAEESVWFDAAYIGSRAALGRLDPDVLSTVRRSDTGRTLADHLTAAGGDVDTLQRGRAFFDPTQVAAYVEAHIEQGPVLVEAGLPIGIVTGVRGCARYGAARCFGTYAHSGATPRAARADAVLATSEFIVGMDELAAEAERAGSDATVTFGVVQTDPHTAAGSKVAGETRFIMDVRSIQSDELTALHNHACNLSGEISLRRNVRFELGKRALSPPALMSPALVDRLIDICNSGGAAAITLPSGAGHDAAAFAEAGIPSAMIFIRNQGGSHNPDERMTLTDFAAASRLLVCFLETSPPTALPSGGAS
jgi:N-carbamoyl-L-amino-acid hydrolase